MVALAVRLPHLTLVPRFTDESLEVLWSLPIARGETFPLTNYDTYYGALFNYLVAASFLLLGPSALAARLVVLTLGVLTVLATYGLARAWGGGSRLAGLLAGGLLALNPAHTVINSHIAWANCTTPLFTTLAVWTLWYAVGGKRRVATGEPKIRTSWRGARAASLVLSGLLWGLALQTHPAVMTLLPGAALYLVWWGRGWLRTGWTYLALAAFGLGYADVIVHNLHHGFESLIAAQRIREEYAQDNDAATGYPAALLAALLLLARLLGGAIDTRPTAGEYLLDLPCSARDNAGAGRAGGAGAPREPAAVAADVLLPGAVAGGEPEVSDAGQQPVPDAAPADPAGCAGWGSEPTRRGAAAADCLVESATGPHSRRGGARGADLDAGSTAAVGSLLRGRLRCR